MNTAKHLTQDLKIGHVGKQMIVVGQYNPGAEFNTTQNAVLKEEIQKLLAACSVFKVGDMFVARSSEEIVLGILTRMWRRMRRQSPRLTFFYKLAAFLRR
jgi:hypothetical protein